MAEIIKNSDKSEYIANQVGEVESRILIGGNDDVVGPKFVPNVNSSWPCFSGSEKYFLNLNRKKIRVGTEKEDLNQEEAKLKIRVGDETDTWYLIGETLEWEIEYDKDPRKSAKGDYVEEWDIQFSDGLKFCYQDTLENDFKVDPDGCETLEEFLRDRHRPDNVVGSYAVFCDRAGHLTRNGKTVENYKSGKLCHIYRPLCTDADGKTAWANLHIDTNSKILRTTIPQEFLDNAKYPVTLDPTIGYTSLGGTDYETDNRIRCHKAAALTTAGATGGKTNKFFTGCCKKDGGTLSWDLGFYSNGEGADVLEEETDDSYQPGTGFPPGEWRETALAGTFDIVANERYYCVVAWGVTTNCGFLYDSDGAGEGEYQEGSSIPSPHGVGWSDSSYRFSMYLEYEAGQVFEFSTTINGQTVTPSIDSQITRAISATINAATSTPATDLQIARALAVTINASTATSAIDLLKTIGMAAQIAAASVTPAIAVNVVRALLTSISGTSTTPAVDLPVQRSLESQIDAVIVTSDIELLIAGIIELATTIAAQTQTSSASLVLQRFLQAIINAQSVTPAIDTAITRPLQATIASSTTTPEIVLDAMRKLSTQIQATSATASVAIQITRALVTQINAGTSLSDALVTVLREFSTLVDSATLTSAIDLVVGGLGVMVDTELISMTARRKVESKTADREAASKTARRTIEKI